MMRFAPRVSTAVFAAHLRPQPAATFAAAATRPASTGVRASKTGVWAASQASALSRPHGAPGLAAYAAMRAFADAAESSEARVMKRVQKYASDRKAELEQATDSPAEDREKILGLLSSEVTAATKWSDLGFDDLDKVEVLLEVEEEFNHTMADEDADAIESVEDTMAYLRKQNIA
mmetsp:Transcript_2581/g.7243  ORF Transcript_2581/g.7243 Transcript_2581/m.7243 type:complete len:175 (+) Transcript_2581:74-598(+)